MDSFSIKGSKFFYFLLFLFFTGWSVEGVAQNDKENEDELEYVEVRILERNDAGEFVGFSMPDSLGGAYVIDEEGRVYNFFSSYEAAYAHYRNGYYPRRRKDVLKGVAYISGAPTVDSDFPKELEIKNENR